MRGHLLLAAGGLAALAFLGCSSDTGSGEVLDAAVDAPPSADGPTVTDAQPEADGTAADAPVLTDAPLADAPVADAPVADAPSTEVDAPPAVTGVYGSAQGDSRNNKPIGSTQRARLAYRFRATTTSAATTLRVQQRGLGGGATYSGGDGGTIGVSIQPDSGGEPSGTILSSLTLNPGNPTGNWEVWTLLTFPSPATLSNGQIYHVVFENVSADPVTNYISLNALFYWGGPYTPRQPTWSDDYAVLYAEPTTWLVQDVDTPIMDLGYADGTHDGMNYIGSMGPNYGSISGATDMVREHFTVSGGDRTVTSANVKVKRINGASPLIITLETGAGSIIEAFSIPSSSIPLGELPTADTEAALGGNTWARATFLSPHVLASGQTYNLRLSTADGTQYIAVPVQEGTTKGMLSTCFTDGDGQGTTDGGSSWQYLYPYLDNGLQDLQFYFE